MRRVACIVALAACSSSPAISATPSTLSFAFDVDAPLNQELYECWSFDVGTFSDAYVSAIRWTTPDPNGVMLHHATLYATDSWSAGAKSDCWDMPTSATGMHVWAPGTPELALPADMGLAWPANTKKVVIQTHAIRTAAAPATSGSVTIDFVHGTPARKAAWMVVENPIPALRPHIQDTSSTSCVAAGTVHAIFDWPHMHLMGQEFHGRVVHPDGSSTPLVDVVPWNFAKQETHPIDVTIHAGDKVETECIWLNTTDQYIFGGPKTTDEMCNHALMVWPAESAQWQGNCP